MNKLTIRLSVCAMSAMFVGLAHGQTLEILHSIAPGEGATPLGALIQASDGNLYGTTSGMYTTNAGRDGTVFKITPNGLFTTLYSFHGVANGAKPWAGLVQAPDGNLYGTTLYGGSTNNYGTIFRISTNGEFTTLHVFEKVIDGSYDAPDGSFPASYGGLTVGPDGAMYGTTYDGGTNNIDHYGKGTVFRITTNGEFTSIVSFQGTNGGGPNAGVVLGNDGNFYGTTYYGGAYNGGTVFKMTLTGQVTTLFSFNPTNGYDGYYPFRAILQASDGNFYGATGCGWSCCFPRPYVGTIFRITPDGVFTRLINCDASFYAFPRRFVQLSDGNLYNTAGSAPPPGGAGSMFQMTLSGSTAPVISFTGYQEAPGDVMEASDGNLYGTTEGGGDHGYGTIFRVVMQAKLSITRNDNQIVLSWPTNFPGFTLQSTDNLNSTNWINSTDCPAVIGGQNVVTNVAAAGNRFYRLKK